MKKIINLFILFILFVGMIMPANAINYVGINQDEVGTTVFSNYDEEADLFAITNYEPATEGRNTIVNTGRAGWATGDVNCPVLNNKAYRSSDIWNNHKIYSYGNKCDIGDYIEMVSCTYPNSLDNTYYPDQCERIFSDDFKKTSENINIEFATTESYFAYHAGRYIGYNCKTCPKQLYSFCTDYTCQSCPSSDGTTCDENLFAIFGATSPTPCDRVGKTPHPNADFYTSVVDCQAYSLIVKNEDITTTTQAGATTTTQTTATTQKTTTTTLVGTSCSDLGQIECKARTDCDWKKDPSGFTASCVAKSTSAPIIEIQSVKVESRKTEKGETKIVTSIALKNNGGDMTSDWIVEAQPKKIELSKQGIMDQHDTCDDNYPENVHLKFNFKSGEEGIAEIWTSVELGTYNSLAVVTDKCCVDKEGNEVTPACMSPIQKLSSNSVEIKGGAVCGDVGDKCTMRHATWYGQADSSCSTGFCFNGVTDTCKVPVCCEQSGIFKASTGTCPANSEYSKLSNCEEYTSVGVTQELIDEAKCDGEIDPDPDPLPGTIATQLPILSSDLSESTSAEIMAAVCGLDVNCLPYEPLTNENSSNYVVDCKTNAKIAGKIEEANKIECKENYAWTLGATALGIVACGGTLATIPFSWGASTPIAVAVCGGSVALATAVGTTQLASDLGCQMKGAGANGLCIANKAGAPTLDFCENLDFLEPLLGSNYCTYGMIGGILLIFILLALLFKK